MADKKFSFNPFADVGKWFGIVDDILEESTNGTPEGKQKQNDTGKGNEQRAKRRTFRTAAAQEPPVDAGNDSDDGDSDDGADAKGPPAKESGTTEQPK